MNKVFLGLLFGGAILSTTAIISTSLTSCSNNNNVDIIGTVANGDFSTKADSYLKKHALKFNGDNGTKANYPLEHASVATLENNQDFGVKDTVTNTLYNFHKTHFNKNITTQFALNSLLTTFKNQVVASNYVSDDPSAEKVQFKVNNYSEHELDIHTNVLKIGGTVIENNIKLKFSNGVVTITGAKILNAIGNNKTFDKINESLASDVGTMVGANLHVFSGVHGITFLFGADETHGKTVYEPASLKWNLNSLSGCTSVDWNGKGKATISDSSKDTSNMFLYYVSKDFKGIVLEKAEYVGADTGKQISAGLNISSLCINISQFDWTNITKNTF